MLGLFDDIKNLKPATKLIGQIIAASLPISLGLVLQVSPWYLVNVLLTYFWFVGIINAVNMLDNMDGLSSGIVMISTFFTALIYSSSYGVNSDSMYLQIAFVLLFSVAGFWVFNKPPASIFMGDSGSLFLGYILAAITIPSRLNGFMGTSSSMLVLIIPVAVLAVPIFDTTFVTVLRKMHGRPASLGGKDHSSHRLVGLGFSEKKAVLMLYILAFLGGIVGVSLSLSSAFSIPFLMLYIILLCFIGIYLGKVKVYPEPSNPEQRNGWTPLVSHWFYKRHAGEVILDIILIAVSYYIAYLLRFEGSLKGQATNYMQSLPIIVASCMGSFFVQGIYRGIWHFISINDIGRYVKGVILGNGIGILIIVALYRFEGYSRTVFIIFSVLLFLLMIGSRLFFRILDNITTGQRTYFNKTKVLIYGAGQAGKLLLEESARNHLYKDYSIIGFIDDDPNKRNHSLLGVKIFGCDDLPRNKKSFKADELWVSSAQIDDEKISALIKLMGDEIKVKRFKLIVE
ncbi:MAG: hypothetical protein M1147_01310 [Nitrospirae bacterium]|nr:hypothetical protein [Nitrospirota bacterium]MCL5976747.1 hypothetical protein [Nitrospirota bacterium]